ncbi:protein of unknown function DUF1549 [Chthoniobacter flavus Ellin428]|uniref:Cytochrome c domain-containing protein n=1 Tax=Chthoniobacter flavus Ellin428 TaxID=497964 RepID=B4CWE5_9BACT|nr:PSD1 and planctomycete cytochrome C domain-containing protein [Chthoniobacter flavus]EDY21737.1 protein of unknown function DUF1549 [Chthoniobacter flavus Ellin428]TCO95672.1 cytochrome c [Chthoniobacter flavus]
MTRQPLFVSFASVGCSLIALATVASAAESTPDNKVHFNRDIRPIFSDTCFHCHGFDPKGRKAGLRLDIREDALKKTDNDVYPIVPGKPDESEIIERLFSTDPDDIMPPPKAHKEIPLAQRELIKRWVAEGAQYEPPWAYAPLNKPAVPVISNQYSVKSGSPIVNPIDNFIREKLAEKKIEPSPEAPKAKLLRRLSLDLIGLPPTPEEVAAFLADDSPDAYEKQVDRLLASPRYGERMAVWWLDVARFTDTVGFHGDQNQRIFPYRDYVINAFNSDKPFDQFTIEQLAGDLLPHPTTEQLVATGYNRLNMMTREGGAQPNEYLAKYGAERVRSVAAAWFGSTFGCSECHDHKFDPIKTRDFYELKSFFADVKQWGVYSDYGYTKNAELAGFNNDYPFPPEIQVDSPYRQAEKKQAEAEIDAHLKTTREDLAKNPRLHGQFEQWITDSRAFLEKDNSGWTSPALSAVILGKGDKLEIDRDVLIDAGLAVQLEKPLTKDESLRIATRTGGVHIASVRIELAQNLADEKEIEASLSKSVKVTASVKAANGKMRRLGVYYADATDKFPRFTNGKETLGVVTEWKLPHSKPAKSPSAVWLLDPPVTLAADEKLVLTISGDSPLPLRISTSPFAGRTPLGLDVAALRSALNTNPAALSESQTALLADTWLFSTAADRADFDRYKELASDLRESRNGKAWTMVTQAVEPLLTRVLPRGNWQSEDGPVVLPSTPSFLPGREESTPEHRLTRLDLAKYIVSKKNPITARAVMNRLWQQFFGTGISSTVDDLGSQGDPPSHPELLDWIASEFRDNGWDFKHMIKLFVMSATYRQSSALRPELHEIDPANRLLASQNPRRLEAEFVRDNALFIAGILNTSQIGGPSFYPYQPPGYYDALQFPNREYVASTGPEQWRRGVYIHWQRTFLHPMLANFDAPARDECAALRVVSNTPQQALTLLNDPTFVEAARLLAGRLLKDANAPTDDARIDRAFQITVARAPKEKERASLEKFLATQRDYYREHVDDAGKLLKIGYAPPTQGDPAEAAAWTTVCRVILNSQEVITRY